MRTAGSIIELGSKWILRKIYRFDRWHVASLHSRPYASDLIKYANQRSSRRSVVEIGCGLGDIVRHLDYVKRHGYDLDEHVLRAARLLNIFTRGSKVTYQRFQFPADSVHQEHDLIIMVNWIHHIHPDILKAELTKYYDQHLCSGGAIILDTVQDPEYQYKHDIRFLGSHAGAKVVKVGAYSRQREVWAIIKP